MKIALLMTTSLDRPAGVRYGNIARELVTLGHQVSIVALHPDFKHCKERRFEWHGVDVRYVGQMHARKSGNQPTRFGPLALVQVITRSTLAMTVAAARLDVDCYHLGKPQPINGVAGLVASRVCRRPLFVDCDDYEAGSNRFSAAWQRKVFAWWEDYLPAHSDGVTTNTHFLTERAQHLGAKHVVRVPNGVRLDQFTPLPVAKRTGLRRALGLHDDFVVGYIGSLSLNNHPVDLLLHAFAEINDFRAKLLLVGGGEDAARLRDLAAQLGIIEQVRFTGHVSPTAVPGFTGLCDVTVDPVYDDAVARARSPLKLMESLALGIPVVTGDVGDRRELLADGQAGFLVKPGSAAALAAGLQHLLREEPLRQAMSEAARNLARQYDWRTLTKAWVHIYET